MVRSSVMYEPLTCQGTMRGNLLMLTKWISSGIDLSSFFHHGKLISYFYSKDYSMQQHPLLKECHLSIALIQVETSGIKMRISRNNFIVWGGDIIPPKT